MPNTSNTKRTPSSSKAKTTVKKKKAARPAKKVSWRVMWIRTLNGEEFVSNARIMSDGVLMYDPTMITYLQGNLVLAPYGLMSQSPTFFLQGSVIIHVNEVTDSIEELYFTSIEETLDHCRMHFDALVEKSTKTVKRVQFDRPGDDLSGGLLSEEIEELIFKENTEPHRTRSQAINDLVKLAESKGKGKKPRGD